MPNLATPAALKFFGTDLSGLQLRACDLDWTFGAGTAVTAIAIDLALFLAGRRPRP